MLSRVFFFTSIRFFSRSCIRPMKDKPNAMDSFNLKYEVEIPVEKDTKKLATHVCGTNLFIEGEDVELKPDSEYPDWLWSMRSPPPLEELGENSKTYWNRIARLRKKEIKHLNSLIRNKTVHK